MRPGLQLYTLREYGDSVVDRIERVAETSYEGVQVSGLGDDDPAEVADALDRTGLDAAGAHVDLANIEADPEGVGLEVDVGLASHAGGDPVALLERYGDRTTLVHLTDSRAESDDDEDTRHVDLSEGEVDLAGCIDAAADAGVAWLLFEHGLSDDPVASMERAEAVIADLLD
ncbi:MAG: TIM barrel protein [Haloarculaceae archaeon]